jgi:hypothetical protein
MDQRAREQAFQRLGHRALRAAAARSAIVNEQIGRDSIYMGAAWPPVTPPSRPPVHDSAGWAARRWARIPAGEA